MATTLTFVGNTDLSKIYWDYCRILYLSEESILCASTTGILEVNPEILKLNQISGDQDCSPSKLCYQAFQTSTHHCSHSVLKETKSTFVLPPGLGKSQV